MASSWHSSKVTIDLAMLKRLDNAAKVALSKTAEAVKTDIINEQVIPFDTGNLQNESTFVDTTKISEGKTSIVSSTPYARKLYYHPEFNFRKTNNGNARGEWFEPWISGSRKSFVAEAFAKIYKGEIE